MRIRLMVEYAGTKTHPEGGSVFNIVQNAQRTLE